MNSFFYFGVESICSKAFASHSENLGQNLVLTMQIITDLPFLPFLIIIIIFIIYLFIFILTGKNRNMSYEAHLGIFEECQLLRTFTSEPPH